MLPYKFVFLLATAILYSCNGFNSANKNPYYQKLQNNIQNVNYDSIAFKLDSLSLPYNSTMQYIDDSLNSYFSFFNEVNQSIYYYNYNSKDLDKIWKVNYSDTKFDAHYIVSHDSIFLYNSGSCMLYLFNYEGVLLNQFHFNPFETDSIVLPYPYLRTYLPIISTDDNLYLSGYMLGETNAEFRKTTFKYDTNKNKVEYLIDFPEIYNKYNWGATYYYVISKSYNPDENKIIISFPLCHDLYLYNLEEKTVSNYYSGSNYIDNIKPYSANKTENIDAKKRLDYYIENSSYVLVFYDKYKKLYYRIAALPLDNTNESKGSIWKERQYSLIVLDADFNHLGEIPLSNIVAESGFVSREGIHLQTFSNDDLIRFKIINIEI